MKYKFIKMVLSHGRNTNGFLGIDNGHWADARACAGRARSGRGRGSGAGRARGGRGAGAGQARGGFGADAGAGQAQRRAPRRWKGFQILFGS